MFDMLLPAPPDAILGLTDAWKNDPNPLKVNLGVGVFKDDAGNTPILASVKAAEALILQSATSKSYMPISGAPEYGACVRELVFGVDHPVVRTGRARTAHTPGGTAALRVGADFLRKALPAAKVWMSTPTWANHKGVFGAAGFVTADYPYYDAAGKGLDFARMCEVLETVPAGDIVLLHACCHNPSGVDLDAAQWGIVAEIAGRCGWLPFLDFAYQGYGDGLEEDRAGVLAFAQVCPEFMIASSFSKNFGLYQDRTGALTLVAGSAEVAASAFSNVEIAIRVNYSNPPAHGGLIVKTILTNETLRHQWVGELDGMRRHIAALRSRFVAALAEHGVPGDYSFIARQKGMFSFSGLGTAQVTFLRERKSIYIVGGGRINVAGITSHNMEYLCTSIKEALEVGE
ncbi:MAG: aspartate/tyrosine/aromatic aminotransferase [Akkermansiaceae bacterium]|nr:aspartate/tyrosine/aromatic aminotransferase [Akkermansiaceae bacterium]MCF7732467.1 aspartate/tyrosine/aromatic aminotransferase [Akkermansiaceae bacterium]